MATATINEQKIEPKLDRRMFLGGSDIAAIFGVSPWKTAYELWEEKTAEELVEPTVEPQREKLYRRGKRFEPWVIELLEEETGIFVVKRNQRYVDFEHEFMACEIDFEYMGELGLCNGDVKTISPFAAHDWGEEGTDEIPLYYCLQFMWGMMVTGRPSTLVAAMIGADDLRIYEVKRDEELIGEIRRRAIAFWNDNVLVKEPPPPATIGDTHKILSKFGGFVSKGSESVWATIQQLREVKAAQKELKTQCEKYEMEIKQALVIEAEALGVEGTPDRFVILGPNGTKMASLTKQHRAAYQVAESEFFVLRS